MKQQAGARALVALVVGLGILIFAGLIVVAVTVASRISDGDSPGFGQIALPLPEGCSIAEATAGEGRLLLRLEGLAERGCDQVIILDLESGRELGRIAARPET